MSVSVTLPAAAGMTKDKVKRPLTYWQGVGRRLRRDRVSMVCAAVLLAIAVVMILAPLIAPYDPYTGAIGLRLRPYGTAGHWLGTDELGRDMLTRLMYGARLSWYLGIVPIALAFVIGGSIGIVAGFAGGWVNMLMMRVTDVFYAFPSVLLAVAISGSLGSGSTNALLALTLVFTPPLIRVAESVTTSVRSAEFISAARMSGASSFRIIREHVLGNVVGTIFVYATSQVSVCMILASGLSFLGLGITPPDAEWGSMLNTLRAAIYTRPSVAVLPGICIFVTSICFNLQADGLRQAMDVRA